MTRHGRPVLCLTIVVVVLAGGAAALARHVASFGMSVEARNALLARQQWPPRVGHLIPWQRPDLIREAVLAQLDAIETPPQS